jgi:FAD:protein FMN transferase
MPLSSYRFEAIGTHFEIVSQAELSQALKQELHHTIETFDRYFSRFRDDSAVRQMATAPGVYVLPKGSQRLFELYETLGDITGGQFNPLVGASLEALGYDAKYSLRSKGNLASPPYDSTVRRQGLELELFKPAVLDIGAAGKGYLVDLLVDVLEGHGVHAYTIDASGDILHKGDMPEVIGLEDPLHPGKVIGSIALENRALCASATNRRAWGDGLHHIVDATTGVPVEAVIATWVLADDAMTADGLATALFFTEPDLLKARYNYEYMRIKADRSIDFSPAFNNALY